MPRTWGRKPRAAAITAQPLAQETRHALEPLIVLNFGKCVFDGIDRVVIGKVEWRGTLAVLGNVENVLLLGRPVKDDVALGRSQLVEWHIGTHAHLTGNLLHEIPHERAPGKHRALIDGLGLIGNQTRLVHLARDTGAATSRARAAAVERQVLGTRCVELATARRTDKR